MRPLLRFKKRITSDLMIFDGQFPQRVPAGFRNVEFNYYLQRLTDCRAVTLTANMPNDSHHIGKPEECYGDDLNGYLNHYPANKDKIILYDRKAKYKANVGYSVFLNETYVALNVFEKHKIPFVFCLYPGGGFFVGNQESDNKIRRICQSKWFRKVLVTQKFTYDYLVENKLCPAEKISLFYGGFVQFQKADVLPRKFFAFDKPHLDICFVAAKYMTHGLNKGFDIFMRTAELLSQKIPKIKIHIVGNFDHSDIPFRYTYDNLKFHGFQTQNFLRSFYSEMDILLSPNRPFIHMDQFDGFPLGIDAGYCGVAIFTADELRMNIHYEPDKEISIISLDPSEIAERIFFYSQHPQKLKELAVAGQRKFQNLFDTDTQINHRLSLFDQVRL